MKITIFYPEGNINDNPSIQAIVESLCDSGHNLHIIVGRRNFHQFSPHPKALLHLVDDEFFRSGYLNADAPFQIAQSELNLGVDADGIIVASYFASRNNTPYGLISYEIFFSDEVDTLTKKREIEACSKIEFAVSQDFLRGQLLCLQNKIPSEKLIYLPVGGRGVIRAKRQYFLHDALNIPRGQKIALLAGSICKWTMADRIVLSTCDWPSEWTLVLHGRYGLTAIESDILMLLHSKKWQNVVVSDIIANSLTELSKILFSVDLGLAFYSPTYTSEYSGKNLRYIGLSSGKIANYLQHGVPVACNEIGVIADLLRECDAGIVTDLPEQLPGLLNLLGQKVRRDNCYSFFERYLDFDCHQQDLMNAIEGVARHKCP